VVWGGEGRRAECHLSKTRIGFFSQEKQIIKKARTSSPRYAFSRASRSQGVNDREMNNIEKLHFFYRRCGCCREKTKKKHALFARIEERKREKTKKRRKQTKRRRRRKKLPSISTASS